MIRIFKLVLLLVVSQVAFGQAPSNYTNINGRYRWIAGMFDSTFHIPKGTTTSLRTGGSTNAGALFYRTTDSSVYYYTGTQWLKIAGASGFVPYTGATQNVDLGQFGLKTKYVEFDTSSQAVADRRLQWSNDEGTLQFGMTNGATITQRIGLEQFARVKNVQGSQINKGQAVYIYGASGDRASVKLADNRADSTSSKTLGVAAEDIAINDVGLVGTFGVVSNLNLSAFNAGDILYLDSVPGQLTKTKPQAPYHLVFIGVVERANSGNGLLFVNPQNGYELEELHNVRITSPVLNNAILAYDSVARLWKDTTLNGIGGVTGSLISGYIPKATGANTIDTSQIFQSNGNIGIGTTSPTGVGGRILHINAGVDPEIHLTNSMSGSGATDGFSIKASSSNSYIYNYGGGLMEFGTNNTPRMRIASNGEVGIGTGSPDSLLTVNFGTHLKGGIRASGLPSAPGTKALRIDASGTISIADTLIDAGGTVTSVATNNGTGITGGTITTSGTLAIDTLLISTRAWRQKGIDSVAALINSNVSGTTNYVSKFTGTNTIGNSQIFDNATSVGIGTATPSGSYKLDVNGNINVSNAVNYSQGGTKYGWTYATTAAMAMEGLQGADISLGTGSGVVATERMIIKNSGSVGIGTNTPDSLFTVAQGAHLQRGVRMSGLPTAPGTKSLRVDANGTLSVSDTLTNGISGSGTTNYIPKFTSSSAIGNSVIYDASGSIGIGTTNPAQKLDITSSNTTLYSSSSASLIQPDGGVNLLIANTGTSGFTSLRFASLNNSYAVGYIGFDNTTSSVGGAFLFGQRNGATSYTEQMRLDANGNLGLGVTPSAWSVYKSFDIETASLSAAGVQVEMVSNAYFNGTNWIYKSSTFPTRYVQNSGAAGGHSWFTAASGTAGNAISFTQAMTLDASGNLAIGETSSSVRLRVRNSASDNPALLLLEGAQTNRGLEISLGTDINGAVGSAAIYNTKVAAGYGGHYFQLAGSTKLMLDANGNLGLGVTPSAWSGLAAIQSAYGVFTGNLQSNILLNAYYDVNTYKYVGTGEAARYRQDAGTHAWFTAPSGTAGNAISFTQAMTLSGTDRTILNVGNSTVITNNAANRGNLIVNGASSSIIQLTVNSTESGYFFHSGTDSELWNTANGYLRFATNNTERMRITSGGNVGIGTTSPINKLYVSDGSNSTTAIFENPSASTQYIGLKNTAGTLYIGNVSNNMYFETNNVERMRITSGGEVLVGRNTNAAAGWQMAIKNGLTVTDGTYEVQLFGYFGAGVGTYTNHDFAFRTNNTERMRITTGGEVYIGNNPADQGAYNLQVNGTGVWGAGAYVDGSDSAVKKNIQPLGSSLDLIKQMNPVTFEYQPFYSKDTTTQTGFIAQELQQVLSDKVYKNGIVKEGGQYLGVAYQHLIPLLVKSIQELEAQVQALKTQLNNR